MLGGNVLPVVEATSGCGSVDQLPRENRADLAIFDSAPLLEDLAVVGRITVHLFVSSSANDTDFIVHLSDVSPGGTKSMLVRFGAQTMRWRDGGFSPSVGMEAGKVYAIDVDLWSTAYIFPKGHKVRIAVSSAAYPYYSTNYNTGFNHLTRWFPHVVKANNTVHFSKEQPSRLSLPSVPLTAIPENPNFAMPAVASPIVV